MNDDVCVEREIELEGSAAELWELVATADGWRQWLVDHAAIEIEVGGVGEVVDDHARHRVLVRGRGVVELAAVEIGPVRQDAHAAQHLGALQRELREELGIEVLVASEVLAVSHTYPDRTVRLVLWRVEQFVGAARGLDGQRLQFGGDFRVLAEPLIGQEFV